MRYAITLLIVFGINFSNGMEKTFSVPLQVRPDQLIKVIYTFDFVQNFVHLPMDVQKIILGFVVQVTAPTKRAALDFAAANFRALSRTCHALNSQSIVAAVIDDLAKRYTQGDTVESIIAIRTAQAGKMILKSKGSLLSKHLADAAQKGQIGKVKFLTSLTYETGTKILDNYSRAACKAILSKNFFIVDYFLELPNIERWINHRGYQVATPLFIAAQENNLPLVITLLAKGADVNISTKVNETVLHKAIDNRNLEMLKLFLASAVTSKTIEQEGVEDTPLLAAIEMRNLDMVVALVNAGANTNCISSSGATPLSRAESNYKFALQSDSETRESASQILEFLKAHGATAKKIKKNHH